MSKNNFLSYNDEYVYFSFRDIHSKSENIFIQNSVDELKCFVNTGAEIEFASPKYQIGQKILGVTHPQRPIPLHMAGHNLTKQKIAHIMKWLKPGTVGALGFDFSCDWVFDVVVKSISDPILYAQRDGKFIIDFEIEFVTTVSPYARNKYDAVFITQFAADACPNIDGQITTVDTGAYNNHLYIPAIDLINVVPADMYNRSGVFQFRIFYLGDSSVTFSIVAGIGSESDVDPSHSATSNTLNAGRLINLGIAKYDYEDFYSKFEAKINKNGSQPLIEYRSDSNVYFINGDLLEQSELEEYIYDLVTNYNYKPMQLRSPAPVYKKTKEEAKAFLTEYSTAKVFACLPAKVSSESLYGEEEYSNSLYPPLISQKASIFYTAGSIDLIDADNFYCGFYDDIYISNTISTPDLQLIVRQYTEVI